LYSSIYIVYINNIYFLVVLFVAGERFGDCLFTVFLTGDLRGLPTFLFGDCFFTVFLAGDRLAGLRAGDLRGLPTFLLGDGDLDTERDKDRLGDGDLDRDKDLLYGDGDLDLERDLSSGSTYMVLDLPIGLT
jgi:hypothetical protein